MIFVMSFSLKNEDEVAYRLIQKFYNIFVVSKKTGFVRQALQHINLYDPVINKHYITYSSTFFFMSTLNMGSLIISKIPVKIMIYLNPNLIKY